MWPTRWPKLIPVYLFSCYSVIIPTFSSSLSYLNNEYPLMFLTHSLYSAALLVKWSPLGDSYAVAVGNKVVVYKLAVSVLIYILQYSSFIVTIQHTLITLPHKDQKSDAQSTGISAPCDNIKRKISI